MAKKESRTACYYPIVAAIKKADDILGPNREWNPVHPEQQIFLSRFYNPCVPDISKIPEIQSVASFKAEEINKFLADRGFAIKLDPFQNPEDFGTASVLDVLVEWLNEGKNMPIRSGKKEYAGVRLRGDGVEFFESAGHPHTVVQLRTKGDDLVYLTMMDKSQKGAELLAEAESIIAGAEAMPAGSFEAVRFPKVKLDQKVDISWLEKMSTRTNGGREFAIAAALQQTKIAMNEKGARAKSAVAIGIVATSVRRPLPDHVINKPFLFILIRPGLTKPLVAAKIERADWKDPGDLANL